MNLGDGLVFAFEDGKPKVILSHHSVQLRNSKEVFDEAVSQKPQRDTGLKRKTIPEASAIRKQNKAPSRLTFKDSSTDNNRASPQAKFPARVGPSRKSEKDKHAASQKQSKVATENSKESMVCLTQEQLQMILSSISQASDNSSVNPSCSSQPLSGESRDELNEETPVNGTETSHPKAVCESADHNKNGFCCTVVKDDRVISHELSPDLFSTLGEREREKKALEAKREQWKKELEEQLALKQQQQKMRLEAELDYSPWGKQGGGATSKASTRHIIRLGEERTSRPASSLEDDGSQSKAEYRKSQQDLPAAIRSAFILGEAAPLEHAFSAKKQEQQRRWLQELDQQREEAKMRRMQEKLDRAQGEDLERWAVHFDSHLKRSSSQLPLAVVEQELEPRSPHPGSHLQCPVGTTGEERLEAETMDATRGVLLKARHLRTMTALLDPAQIEDRERKRLKDLEHQCAILAQVGERRRQREQEAALRQAEEQAEERRLALEWERQQQRYQMDILRQKEKEELHTRKTEELYLSVQRAQDEAMKDKQQQRIRELAGKGHDVSKLLLDRDKAFASTHTIDNKDTLILTRSLQEDLGNEAEGSIAACPRKDTAVQTDTDLLSMGWTAGVATVDRNMATRVPTDYRPPSNVKKPKREVRMLERSLMKGKENVCLEDTTQGADPYEAFARTDRDHLQQGGRAVWNMRRPSKPFIPASERYPPGLRQHRQESRLRRQMELLTLMENSTSRAARREPSPPRPTALHRSLTQRREEHFQSNPSVAHQENGTRSPPVPAVERRLQQQTARPTSPPVQEAAERPPSSFIPYVRTDEVYHLDPLAPISRPLTQGHQLLAQPDVDHNRPTSNAIQHDPLLNPELLKNKARQQAILKRLAELRQGLLQKQKELESGFNPLLLGQEQALPSIHHPL